MNVKPQLATARIVLKSLGAQDLAPTLALWTDPDVRKYLWDNVVIDLNRAIEVIAASQDHCARFAIWALDDS